MPVSEMIIVSTFVQEWSLTSEHLHAVRTYCHYQCQGILQKKRTLECCMRWVVTNLANDGLSDGIKDKEVKAEPVTLIWVCGEFDVKYQWRL